jgi:hypothetical protein
VKSRKGSLGEFQRKQGGRVALRAEKVQRFYVAEILRLDNTVNDPANEAKNRAAERFSISTRQVERDLEWQRTAEKWNALVAESIARLNAVSAEMAKLPTKVFDDFSAKAREANEPMLADIAAMLHLYRDHATSEDYEKFGAVSVADFIPTLRLRERVAALEALLQNPEEVHDRK